MADAVRWVLGEQGQHALRAKKTEEVIFSGGQGRAPAGMAEATLTFDNAEGWLPIEFTEVSVTRRAFRSGENQYLINGRKVRLKDVALLTAGLGQSHVVVGQGLVDAALSLRADERRGLFEHAADLTGLRLKVAEAERNLTETDANTARLQRPADRAGAAPEDRWNGPQGRRKSGRAFATACATCRAHTTGRRWRRPAAQRTRPRPRLAAAAAALAAARDEVARLTAAGERAVAKLTAARATLAEHDERRAALEERQRRQTHERDLAAARIEALGKRRADMEDARTSLDERVAAWRASWPSWKRSCATWRGRPMTPVRPRRGTVAPWRSGGRPGVTIETDLAAATRALAESERQRGRSAAASERFSSRATSRWRPSRSGCAEAIAEREARIAALEADVAALRRRRRR